METNTEAPDLTTNYPSRGKRLGPAWRQTWKLLEEAARQAKTSGKPKEAWLDGSELCATVAPEHGIHVDTLRGLLYRMVNGGILDRKVIQVETEKGLRDHTHFRISK